MNTAGSRANEMTIGKLLSAQCPQHEVLYTAMAAALQAGYSYIELQGERTLPAIEQFFDTEDKQRIAKSVLDAHQECTAYTIRKGNRIYFTHIFERHKHISQWYKQESLKCTEDEKIDEVRLHALQLYSQGVITQEQQHAICAMAKRRICPIFGGPGTGKSYVAAQFLRAYLETHNEQKWRICLTGPTGKAAQLLYEGVKRHLGTRAVDYRDHIEVTTLHALLNIGQGKEPPATQLPFHIIIVDEASMLDEQVAYLLLQRLGNARLILLGDPYQLPPVAPGDAFQTIKEIEQAQGTYLELTECKRIEVPHILSCAHSVRDGNCDKLQQVFALNHDAVRFVDVPDEAMEQFLRQQRDTLLRAFAVDTHTLGHRLPFVLLSPCRHGIWGIEQVNAILLQSHAMTHAVPIIVTKNNYDLGVMNGEVGVLSRETIYFSSGKQIPKKMLPYHDVGYCISVHKSQGSEFDHVVVLLPPTAERFDVRMLYTAITRAKKSVAIWGNKERLYKIIETSAVSAKEHCCYGQKNHAVPVHSGDVPQGG